MAGLLAAEQVAGAADLEVLHRDRHAAAEVGVLGQRGEPLVGGLGERLLGRVEEVGVGPLAGPADAALQARPHPRCRVRKPAAEGARPGTCRDGRLDRADERRGNARAAEVLAHHYDAAFSYLHDDDLRRKARAQLLAAAANAHRRFAIQQGEHFAQRAVELSEGGAERVEALEALGDLHYLAYFGDAAWRTYGEALAEISESDPAYARVAGKAALFGARWIGTMHELPPVEEVARLVDAGLRAAPDQSHERVLLLIVRGFLVHQRQGRRDDVARAAVDEAVTAAERLDDADLMSGALDLMQSWESEDGRHGDAYRTTLWRGELIPRMRDIKEIGDSYAMASATACRIGRYREAELHASECIEHSRALDPGSYLHGLAWRVPARFKLGDWEGMLADQEEIERVAALDPRELPVGYTMRAYTHAALCHDLRGERDEADRYIELTHRYYLSRRAGLTRGGAQQAPPLALALARRGRFDEALDLIPLVLRDWSTGVTLEALCEIAALRERWDDAPELVAAAREEAEIAEDPSLRLFADRLDGRAAGVSGDLAHAATSSPGPPTGSRSSSRPGRRHGPGSSSPRSSQAVTRNEPTASSR